MRFLRLLAALVTACAALAGLRAAEPALPPRPAAYFNDYARLVRADTARALNAQLDQFERATSSQIVVAIFPQLPEGADLTDYTERTAQAWKAGQKGRDNGAVLFVFSRDHQIRIETGYGLEGVLPDAICKRIIEDEMVPRFRRGDYDGGVAAGVAAMLAATRNEYHGNGRTADDSRQKGTPPLFVLIFFLVIIVWSVIRSRRHDVYSRSGRSGMWGGGGPWIFPGGGGGGWSGGGGGGGGGGFSGGGGGFGGGGAGGSW